MCINQEVMSLFPKITQVCVTCEGPDISTLIYVLLCSALIIRSKCARMLLLLVLLNIHLDEKKKTKKNKRQHCSLRSASLHPNAIVAKKKYQKDFEKLQW